MQQGLSALRILGIDKEVLSAGVVSSEHASYDKFGNLLGIYGPNSSVRESPEFKSVESRILSDSCSDGDSIGSSSEPSSASSSAKRRRFNVHIPRQMLRDIMLRKVDPRCITWGHKVTGCCLDIPSGGARLTFDNGTETVADVVVAADGINSVLRRIFYPDRPLQYLGLLVVLGISKRDDINFNGSEVKYRKVQWVDGTTRVFSMPFDRNNIMWQLSFPIGDEQAALIASETPASLHAAALQMCDGWDTPLIDLIRNTDLCMISGHPVYDLDPSVIYGKESQSHPVLPRVTFVGDSVHPMSPFKGQGANQALADAISLAASLSRLYTGCHDDFIKSDLMTDDDKKSFDGALVSSLIKYESEMRERSISKVLKSRTAAVSLHSEAALAVGNITRAAAAAAAVST